MKPRICEKIPNKKCEEDQNGCCYFCGRNMLPDNNLTMQNNQRKIVETRIQTILPELKEFIEGGRVVLKKLYPIRMWPGCDPLRQLVFIKEATIFSIRLDGSVHLREIDGQFYQHDFTYLGIEPNLFHYVRALTIKKIPFRVRVTQWSYWLIGDKFSLKMKKDNLNEYQLATENDYQVLSKLITL